MLTDLMNERQAQDIRIKIHNELAQDRYARLPICSRCKMKYKDVDEHREKTCPETPRIKGIITVWVTQTPPKKSVQRKLPCWETFYEKHNLVAFDLERNIFMCEECSWKKIISSSGK